MSGYLDQALRRAKEMEVQYIPRHDKEKFEAEGWEVSDCLGEYHGIFSLLAIRRGNADDTVS